MEPNDRSCTIFGAEVAQFLTGIITERQTTSNRWARSPHYSQFMASSSAGAPTQVHTEAADPEASSSPPQLDVPYKGRIPNTTHQAVNPQDQGFCARSSGTR